MRKIASEQAAAQPKKKGIYLVLIIIAAAVLAVSAYMLISYYAGADSEENTYGELTSAHVSMDEQEVEEQIQKMNFKTGISLSDGTYYYDPTLTDYYSVLADRNIGYYRLAVYSGHKNFLSGDVFRGGRIPLSQF